MQYKVKEDSRLVFGESWFSEKALQRNKTRVSWWSTKDVVRVESENFDFHPKFLPVVAAAAYHDDAAAGAIVVVSRAANLAQKTTIMPSALLLAMKVS